MLTASWTGRKDTVDMIATINSRFSGILRVVISITITSSSVYSIQITFTLNSDTSQLRFGELASYKNYNSIYQSTFFYFWCTCHKIDFFVCVLIVYVTNPFI